MEVGGIRFKCCRSARSTGLTMFLAANSWRARLRKVNQDEVLLDLVSLCTKFLGLVT